MARQPEDPEARHLALLALISCPVGAIGSASRAGLKEATAGLPVEVAPGILRCGYAARSSFGAAAWLVRRPDGNVMVDFPRFAPPLARRIKELGGARLLFLTHRDDVADHARWRTELGCERVLHARDKGPGTRNVERTLSGDDPVALSPDLLAVPVPGSTALLFRSRFLFSGDHVFGDALGRLSAARDVCWFDWDAQARSVERLAALDFEWVLPGHGRPWRAASPAAAQKAARALAAAMRSYSPLPGDPER